MFLNKSKMTKFDEIKNLGNVYCQEIVHNMRRS